MIFQLCGEHELKRNNRDQVSKYQLLAFNTIAFKAIKEESAISAIESIFVSWVLLNRGSSIKTKFDDWLLFSNYDFRLHVHVKSKKKKLAKSPKDQSFIQKQKKMNKCDLDSMFRYTFALFCIYSIL